MSICYRWGRQKWIARSWIWNASCVEESVPREPVSSTGTQKEGGRLQGTDIYFSYIYGLVVREAERLKMQLKWIELKVLPQNQIFIYVCSWLEGKKSSLPIFLCFKRLRHERDLSSVKLNVGCSFIPREIRDSLFDRVKNVMHFFGEKPSAVLVQSQS